MNSRLTLSASIVVCALALGVDQASGELITFGFAADITEYFDDLGLLAGGDVSSGISGTFTFESTTPDADPSDPGHGQYAQAIVAMSGHIAGVPFEIADTAPAPFPLIEVFNRGSDTYRVDAKIRIAAEPLFLTLQGVNLSGDLFADDTLPLDPPLVAAFDSIFLVSPVVLVSSTAETFWVQAQLTALTPEPTSIGMFALGALALMCGRCSSLRLPGVLVHSNIAQDDRVCLSVQ